MAETAYVPVIISAIITPNPAQAGEPVMISIAAADVACVPYTQMITAGEGFAAGEF